jgi:16S rRNA (guanine527-N7)-methyltransferase
VPSTPADPRAAFLAAFPVSRETELRLEQYDALLRDWNQRLSLVANSTLDSIWSRHFLDSAQLMPLIPEPARPVIDIGTGAGFPGVILAIMGLPHIHLVEHNMRKVGFLRTVIAALGLEVTLHAMKVESVKPFAAGAVTARAFRPLAELVGLGRKFLRDDAAVAIFPKGRRAEEELTEARRLWRAQVERFPSLTDPDSTIFRLSGIAEARA